MTQNSPLETDDPCIVVEFLPLDAAGAELIRQEFDPGNVVTSSAFTGGQIVAVVVAATTQAFAKVLDFFASNRPNYRDATVKIGRREIALKGFSMEEVKALVDSPEIKKLLKELEPNER